LTRTVRQYGYSPLVPIGDRHNVGDAYTVDDLSEQPLILLTDRMSKNDVSGLMRSIRENVALENVTFSKTYDLKAEAEYIGYLRGILEAKGITKYQVAYSGAHQYVLSAYRLNKAVLPHIRSALRQRDDAYIIYALLQVSSIEYRFFNSNGVKVELSPGSVLENQIKAALGASWRVDEQKNLSVKQPMFIGYRIAYTELDRKNASREIKPVPAREIRAAQRQRVAAAISAAGSPTGQ
jgi:hypothetical protein